MPNFLFSKEELVSMVKDQNYSLLESFGHQQGVAQGLSTDLKNGLSKEEQLSYFAARLSTFGANKLPQSTPTSFFSLVIQALNDITLIILIIAAFVSITLGLLFHVDGEDDHTYIEGLAILFAVVVVTFVAALNDYQKEKQFRSLNEAEADKEVSVIRYGKVFQISVFSLLVGDLVVLRSGDVISCDGLVVSSSQLTIDESSMTGESDAVNKSATKPFLLAGTTVINGSGTMLVTGVGESTEYGNLLTGLSLNEKQSTPLQAKLTKLATDIGKIGIAFALLTFFALLIPFVFNLQEEHDLPFIMANFTNFLVVAITIVVVAVPEGLPLAVTISLAYSVKKMMKLNNLVRHLDACETIGSATVICSDKTGTLTQNQMTVVTGQIGLLYYETLPKLSVLPRIPSSLLIDGISLNSDAYLTKGENGLDRTIGSPTEGALLSLLTQWGVDFERIREDCEKISTQTFNSKTKQMSTIAKSSFNQSVYLHIKGASESVLPMTKYYLNEQGLPEPLTLALQNKMQERIKDFAINGLRTIVLACKDVSNEPRNSLSSESYTSDDLCFLAIFGIKDPARVEVPRAIQQCRRAGIQVKMVSGDLLMTCKQIATEVGILTDGIAIEAKDFRNLNDKEMVEILPRLQVLARSQPSDKQLLVSKLKLLGEVCAVTGDGTNDASALKKADVGLAMGIQGTSVAKEASDIIILDDSFASIVNCVHFGRTVYRNIQKFIQFQLTVNLVALILSFLSAVTQKGLPMNPVQLLWINLIMDSLAALALATEQPTPDLMEASPPRVKDSLISKVMVRNIVGQCVFQLSVLLILLYYGHLFLNVEDESLYHYTFIFTTFVFCQVFNELNCRKISKSNGSIFDNLLGNRLFVFVVVGTIIVQIVLVSVGGQLTRTVPLSLTAWVVAIGIGMLSIPVAWFVQMIDVDKKSDALKYRLVQ
ncbi:hypothetical protein P9112_004604 [Eukaryota sp. TZLM1-RC]